MNEKGKNPEDMTDDLGDDFMDDDEIFDIDDFDEEFEEEAPAAPEAPPQATAAAPADAEITDDDFDDVSWDDMDADDAQSESGISDMPASSGKSPLKKYLPVLVGTVVVLGGAGWFLMQPGGTSQTSSLPAGGFASDEMASGEATGTALPGLDSGLPGTDNAELALEETRDKIKNLEQEMAGAIEEAPPMPAPMNSIPEEDPGVLTPMPGASGGQQLASLDQPLEPDMNKRDIETEALEAPPALTEITPPPPAPPVAAMPDEATRMEVSQLSERVTALEKNIVTLNKELEQKLTAAIKDMSKASPAPAPVDSGKLNIIEEKMATMSATVARMEKNLAEMKKAPEPAPAPIPAPAAAKPAEKAVTPAPEPAAKPAEPVKAAPAKAPEPAPVKAAPKAATTEVKTSPSTAVEIRPTPAPVWQLRFAQPGKAMVAAEGSSDLRTVEIGDSLEGIGKITAIAQEDGKWVVTGSKGKISQ